MGSHFGVFIPIYCGDVLLSPLFSILVSHMPQFPNIFTVSVLEFLFAH
jgi:hypothetical protein